MISAEHRRIVKETAAILEKDGEELTRRFYETLLANNPEFGAFFNESHQRDGKQHRVFAHAMLQYARHLDDLGLLGCTRLEADVRRRRLSRTTLWASHPGLMRF